MAREGALEALVRLACMEDIECQEYAAFALAHVASNRDYQVRGYYLVLFCLNSIICIFLSPPQKTIPFIIPWKYYNNMYKNVVL